MAIKKETAWNGLKVVAVRGISANKDSLEQQVSLTVDYTGETLEGLAQRAFQQDIVAWAARLRGRFGRDPQGLKAHLDELRNNEGRIQVTSAELCALSGGTTARELSTDTLIRALQVKAKGGDTRAQTALMALGEPWE